MNKMRCWLIWGCLVLLVGFASATPPVANFTATPLSGIAPLPVSFSDISLNNPGGWAWYFGDENFTVPWTLVNASAEWTGRYYHSSVVMPDSSIVLMGGNDGVYKNDVWRSTNKGLTWTLLNASAGWSPRDAPSSVAMPDGSIVLMGGYNDSGFKNDTWQSTDNGATWALVNASPGWTARALHSSVAMPDGGIVLIGGLVDSIGTPKNDVWRSTDNGATWVLVNASQGWGARYSHSSVAMPDGSIVLTGGSAANDGVWRSTDNGATWTQMNASPGWSPERYEPSSVAMPDGSIVLMGGWTPAPPYYKNDVWRSTDNGKTWIQLNADAGWTARRGHTSDAMPDGSIMLMGGTDIGGIKKSDVWRFMPAGSSAQTPSYIYTAPGIYTVALQAYNADGYNSIRKTGYICVVVDFLPLPGFSTPPTDPDSDGLYEDLNANKRMDFNDVVLMFNQMQWISANEPICAFDINRNGRIDFNDIVNLFGEI